jgi:pSer/pThr/pTyr-binding forkhead associated (FHA) protein
VAAGGRSSRRRRAKTPQALVVTSGPHAGTSIPLGTGPITIGRGQDATLVLTDEYASAHHARLAQRDGQWWVEDLGSTNGTYVDGVRITGPRPVAAGMPIRVGKTTVELRA